ncbi:MAG: response regulator transcription factor [Ferruginibacter sp.]|nr:response regulator transcription factor [Cytophagales bacterium]
MTPTKILLVEDDPNLGQILREYLDLKGYLTDLARDGEQAFRLFQQNRYDLGLFDVMLPKKDGFSLAREIRMVDKNIPIIFLTAKSLKEDTLEGFRLGADDYLTKPFSMEELLLRMKAVLRRSQPAADAPRENTRFRIGTFTFDSEQQTLQGDQEHYKLTSKEAELLKLLAINKNQTLGRSLALKMIWQDDTYFNARSMDVYITKLRKYLKSDPAVEIINVHGTGFRLMG